MSHLLTIGEGPNKKNIEGFDVEMYIATSEKNP